MAIRVTPDELEQCSKNINNENGQLQSLVASLNSHYQRGMDGFEGNSADRFRAFWDEVYPILSKSVPETLNDLATQLAQKADAFRTADS